MLAMLNRRDAFTLIEFIMVIVLLSIIAGIGLPLLAEISQAWVLDKQKDEIAQSARLAVDRMIREIRRAEIITVADADSLEFTDIDSTSITFDISSAALRRRQGALANLLAENVASLDFTYYDDSGSEIAVPVADPSLIRRIELNMSFSLGDALFNIRSQVSPRRLQ